MVVIREARGKIVEAIAIVGVNLILIVSGNWFLQKEIELKIWSEFEEKDCVEWKNKLVTFGCFASNQQLEGEGVRL